MRMREEQKWDGFPQNPKDDGFHWLKQNGCGRLIPFEWEPVDELWLFDCESDDCYPDSVKKMFKYHGPCLPPEAHPANVAALEARIAELEKERDQFREGYLEMEALRKFYATDERHLKVVAIAREALASDGDPS